MVTKYVKKRGKLKFKKKTKHINIATISPSSPSYHNWRFVVVVVMMVDVLVHVMVLVLLVGAESIFRLRLLFGSSFIVINVVVVVVVNVILVTIGEVFVIHLALLVVVGWVLGRREEILLQPSHHLLFGSGLFHFAVPVLQLVGGWRLLHLAALVVEVRTAAVVGRQIVGARSLVQRLANAVRAPHFQFARLQEHFVGGCVVVGCLWRRTLPAVDVLAGHRRRFPPLAVVRRQQRMDQRIWFSARTDGMEPKINI